MNHALTPGDCGHRGGITRWQSGLAGALSRAFGLVARVTTAASSPTLGHGCQRLAYVARVTRGWGVGPGLAQNAEKPAAAVLGGPEGERSVLLVDGLLSRRRGGGAIGGLFVCSERCRRRFSLCGGHRVDDIHHSDRGDKQMNSAGDGGAMMAGGGL